MMRWPIIALTFVLAMSRAAAQDMPLSQVLIEGEGWKETSRDTAVFRPPSAVRGTGVEAVLCNVRSPDRGTMFVGSATGNYVWAFRVEKDGSFSAGQPYCSLRVPRGQEGIAVNELTVDDAGRIYAATALGVQIFDPTGRLSGVLAKPSREPITLVRLVGDSLYIATSSAAVYVRKVKARSVEKPE
jgi:hypothetical protein